LRRQQEERAAAERARQQTEVERYVRLIQQQVARAWIRPPNWAGQQCMVRVHIIPGGDVIDVTMVRSCGDPVLDRSVESAVRRAAPLPVPPADSGLFDRFRELEFVFKPEPFL
jgi:colicin import membrane protein